MALERCFHGFVDLTRVLCRAADGRQFGFKGLKKVMGDLGLALGTGLFVGRDDLVA
ncbi:hypothetical protein [Rhodovibrio salinarum]|uniref:hypothetical protein n=1 Tax=Rhodovibrio salinarum TaxID=1087 RepID=UPI0004B99E31|nr:hypothetical protein [Rhodovibrio salinarum]